MADQALLAERLETIPLTSEIAISAALLPEGFPGDPADRITYAAALDMGVRLVTKDRLSTPSTHSELSGSVTALRDIGPPTRSSWCAGGLAFRLSSAAQELTISEQDALCGALALPLSHAGASVERGARRGDESRRAPPAYGSSERVTSDFAVH